MSDAESRRIVLVRHAKADWPQVSDHERPLAERGRKDAPVTGRKLADADIVPDLVVCSTATRTRETFKLMVPELPTRPKTVYEERVYEASPGQLIALLEETPDEVRTLALVGHNPGVQALAEILAGESEPEAASRMAARGFPTAAYAVLTFTGPWKSLEPGVGTLVDYWAPGGE
ncbi:MULTISPECIES: SixA phosphatase family protein [Streptomyces]|uniref:Histidine phosphatase family protein n=1 Tax=Streptomyces physcomitrii TaxID=2724184 RepID=A0ABX1GYJ0_9ACTN|nr:MULTISPECIES: histidine phosphatase family protein [Streptomyces]NKI41157.1 histidine phosphatase family protein [Streptomyces physcomitrii]